MALDLYESSTFTLPCGILQGSSISPTLFNIYVTDLPSLFRSFSLSLTSYGDDTQIVLSAFKNGTKTAAQFHDCMLTIGSWMSMHCLKLNSGKTEVVLFGNISPIWSPAWWPDELGPLPIPVTNSKNLQVIIDEKRSFGLKVNAITSSFYLLKSFKNIEPYIPAHTKKTVITTLVLSKLDYCNGLYLNMQENTLITFRLCRTQQPGFS